MNRVIVNLSKGYRQRVGLAQALLGSPPLLILDEPTEGLDPNQRGEVLKLIKSLAGKHTVVLSTHILSEVKAISERVLIIHRGKIAAHDDLPKLTGGAELGLEETFIKLTAA
jgi:ABC-2 type transport system ATP-binding protein